MARVTKLKFKILFHVFIISFFSYFAIQECPKTVTIKKLNRFLPDLKHILIWTKIYGIDEEGQDYFVKKRCVHINCYFTTNRTFFRDLRYFDAILFNLQDVSGPNHDIPKVRSLKQKYIFAANDSADNYPVCEPVYDDFFNWTWTYRTDSSIPYQFVAVYNLEDEKLDTTIRWNKNMTAIDANVRSQLYSKSKPAAIFLDKCKTKGKREEFLKNLKTELNKYNLSMDVFGTCGNLQCKKKSMKPCYWKLKKMYYFYLAFEDSIAVDYLTDAVLYGYNNNAVPIVYGGAFYDQFLPPHSFINGFQLGEKTLAKTMYEVISSRKKYFDYFRWKNHYIIRESKVLDPCVLCEAMNNPLWLNYNISYKNFRYWWHPYFVEECSFYKNYFII